MRDALASTTDNKLRVTATMQAYFDFVADAGRRVPARLRVRPHLRAVRARPASSSVLQGCAELVSAVIAEDAGLSEAEAHLLAVGLIGTAQVTARYWITTGEADARATRRCGWSRR